LDKLHNIDDLLRNAAAAQDLPELDADAWSGVEKKLKRRRIRLAAFWILLPLFFVSASIFTVLHYTSEPTSSLTDTKNRVEQHISDKNTSNNEPTPTGDEVVKRELKLPPQSRSVEEPIRDTYTGNNPTAFKTDMDAVNNEESFSNRLSFESILLSSKRSVNLNNPPSFFVIDPIHLKLPKDKKEEAKKGHWEIGYAFTPSISGKYAAQNAENSWMIHKNYDQFVLNNEKVSFANSQGINLQYHQKHWFIATGLFISQRTENINYNYTITEFPVANQNTREVQYLPLTPDLYKHITHSGSNSYHFVEIPLNIGYKHALSPKFEIRAQTGVSLLHLINREGSKADFFNLDLESLENITFNETNVAANVKAGLYYNTRFVILGVEPSGSINTTNFASRDNGLELRPFNYGLNLVTQIKLRN
jgi:hypothetical protein